MGSEREGKRETRHGGVQQSIGWLVGWLDEYKVLIATVDEMIGVT